MAICGLCIKAIGIKADGFKKAAVMPRKFNTYTHKGKWQGKIDKFAAKMPLK